MKSPENMGNEFLWMSLKHGYSWKFTQLTRDKLFWILKEKSSSLNTQFLCTDGNC